MGPLWLPVRTHHILSSPYLQCIGACPCPAGSTPHLWWNLCFPSSCQNQTEKLPSQDARLPVCSQLDPILSSKDPSVLSGAMPVAAQEPVTFLAGMALARPVDEPLLHQVIVPAHGCCWNNSVVVGCPSHDQRIELCDDPRLWSGLQLLQAL